MNVFLHNHQKTFFKRVRWGINIVKHLCQMFKEEKALPIFLNVYVFTSPLNQVTTECVVCLNAEDVLVHINVEGFLLHYLALHLVFYRSQLFSRSELRKGKYF